MIAVSKLLDWAHTLSPTSSVGIDDAGLTLLEAPTDGSAAAYLEIGGYDPTEADTPPSNSDSE